MMDFPQLDPIPMRAETDPNYQKEIWQPEWNCFCCQDTGIAKNAARMFIKDWNLDRHKLPICRKPNCKASEIFSEHPEPRVQASLDWRLSPEMCEEVDRLEREAWREWAKKRQKNDKVIDYSEAVKSLRKRSRSSEEEYLAKRNHAEEKSK